MPAMPRAKSRGWCSSIYKCRAALREPFRLSLQPVAEQPDNGHRRDRRSSTGSERFFKAFAARLKSPGAMSTKPVNRFATAP